MRNVALWFFEKIRNTIGFEDIISAIGIMLIGYGFYMWKPWLGMVITGIIFLGLGIMSGLYKGTSK